MAADPCHIYLNEAERANWDIYDNFNVANSFVTLTLVGEVTFVTDTIMAILSSPDLKVMCVCEWSGPKALHLNVTESP